MSRSTHQLLCICIWRFNSFRILGCIFIFTCFSFILLHYSYINNTKPERIPSSITTRLFPDMPITINLGPYSVCHPKELYLQNITLQYHHKYPDKKKQACFLIEHLDGGPWRSYITHEFAEILVQLKELGNQSNIIYRPFPQNKFNIHCRNITKLLLDACDIGDNLSREDQVPIVILIWDVNRINWYAIRQQLDSVSKAVRLRLLVFIDDLHYTQRVAFLSRQYLFESVASEVLATYPYLFDNYYNNISSNILTWSPHAASILSYRSINESAENVLFVSGANLVDWYPCRALAFDLCKTRKDLTTCLQHPGYGITMKTDSSYYYGEERYFSYMRKYTFGLGSCQSVHYAIAKLFELPANGLALVTTNDLVSILEKLHLYRNEHFLTINCSSSENLINEITQIKTLSKEKVIAIRKKSQEIIFQRHLTKHRSELVHVRLLSQALIESSISDVERKKWEQWGRNC